jgi:hypothetical protein
MKPSGNILCQALDLGLLGFLGLIVVEARQYVLLVKSLQVLALCRDVCKELRDLIGYVGPSRWQKVHLNHGVAIVLECAGRQQATAIFRRIGVATASAGDARNRPGGILVPLSGVMSVRLPVGDVASDVDGSQKGAPWEFVRRDSGLALYRLVRSRHMADAG